MFCKNCGQEINDRIKFCAGCGNKVENNNEEMTYSNNFNNFTKKNKNKGRIINIVIGVTAVLVILLLVGIFAGENEYVSVVKNGTFNDYPDVLIGEAVDDFFSNPKWKYFVSDDDFNVVEFTGRCSYDNADVDVLLQFMVYEDDTFELSYFSMNDISQNLFMVSGLIEKVIGEYNGD